MVFCYPATIFRVAVTARAGAVGATTAVAGKSSQNPRFLPISKSSISIDFRNYIGEFLGIIFVLFRPFESWCFTIREPLKNNLYLILEIYFSPQFIIRSRYLFFPGSAAGTATFRYLI